MLLSDGRHVPDLHLDGGHVARCRALADRVTAQVLELVERHTTVSIERTVLRLYGLHDAGPRGVPLVNLAVDALHERGLLGRGAAYWMGYALRRGASDPLAVVERLASLPRHPEPLAEAEERAMLAEMRREAKANVDELLERVRRRDALKDELGVGPRPHR
jgi:beta-lysine 5,6-aminomutase alpha subunit